MGKFSGGLILDEHKRATEDRPIREAIIPKQVALPLQQNLGCPSEALVKEGDTVREGQKIADSSKFVFAPIHASISGKVVRIEKLPNPCGFDVPSIVIEGDGSPVKENPPAAVSVPEKLLPDDIRLKVKEAGIVGLGGAAFPTHVKLNPPAEKNIDTVIINGCECEPYLTADHRIMLERGEDLLYGARIITRATGAQKIIFGIENNKPDCVKAIKTLAQRFENMQVAVVRTKYPQGGEKMLIKSILGREVPSGGLPLDVGVVVQNVATSVAIAEAIKFNRPLIKKVITVTGSGIKEPQNLLIRIGTSFKEIIDLCGGLKEDAAKVIMGGPMTGIAISSLDMPVVKAASGILVLNKKEAKVFEESNCIRCGRCIKSCPTGLLPNFLADFAKLKDWDKMAEYHVADCIECGCCSYICPSRIFLVQYFKVGKRELQTRKAVCR